MLEVGGQECPHPMRRLWVAAVRGAEVIVAGVEVEGREILEGKVVWRAKARLVRHVGQGGWTNYHSRSLHFGRDDALPRLSAPVGMESK